MAKIKIKGDDIRMRLAYMKDTELRTYWIVSLKLTRTHVVYVTKSGHKHKVLKSDISALSADLIMLLLPRA